MAKIAIEDLSGSTTPLTENPYDGLLNASNEDPKLIQERYVQHRLARNGQQKELILADEFAGWILDEHLTKLSGAQKDPTFKDERNCLIFWARPPKKVKTLVHVIQQKLQDAAPDIWTMPLDNIHLSTIEIAYSRTAEEVEKLVEQLKPVTEAIADYPMTHRARLVKPLLSYDAAAIALTFVPAAGESTPQGRRKSDDNYTYHHLRRDIYNKISIDADVPVGSRYVVPSAHLTIARFNSPNPFGDDPLDAQTGKDMKKRKHWIKEIEMINKWLEAEYWPQADGKPITPGGEWVVGEEKGLDFRKGTLWYGGGETVYLGKGF